jgi:hypothetical protein
MAQSTHNPLRFLHLPKCGGSTFSYVLTREYKGLRAFEFAGDHVADRARFEELKKQDPTPVSLFRGHAPIETSIAEADSPQTITLFRDPVSRVKSFCQHVSEGKSPQLVEQFPPATFDLDVFLESGLGELSNLQTKMMINCASCVDDTQLNQLGLEQSVELALKNLDERIVIFGLVERYDESLIHFADYFGWGLPIYAKKNIKSEKRLLTFEVRHLDKIRDLNQADGLFYERVKALFALRYVLTETQKRKLQNQRMLNKYVMPCFEAVRMQLFACARFLRSKIKIKR